MTTKCKPLRQPKIICLIKKNMEDPERENKAACLTVKIKVNIMPFTKNGGKDDGKTDVQEDIKDNLG